MMTYRVSRLQQESRFSTKDHRDAALKILPASISDNKSKFHSFNKRCQRESATKNWVDLKDFVSTSKNVIIILADDDFAEDSPLSRCILLDGI